MAPESRLAPTSIRTRLSSELSPLGNPIASSFTGSATQSPTAEILAIRLEKDEPSQEGEILRGVHDNQTVYTLTLTNNSVNPTVATTIDDYLPAASVATRPIPTTPRTPRPIPAARTSTPVPGQSSSGQSSDCFARSS